MEQTSPSFPPHVTSTTSVLARFQSQLEAETSRDKNQDLAIGDSVGLHTLSRYYMIIFYVSYIHCSLLKTNSQLSSPWGFSLSPYILQTRSYTCTTHVFIGSGRTVLRKISRYVDACAVSVYQALLSTYETEPGFEAIQTADSNITCISRVIRYNSMQTVYVHVLAYLSLAVEVQ